MQICYTSRNTKKCLDSAEAVLDKLKLSDKETDDNRDDPLIWDKALYKLTDIPDYVIKMMCVCSYPIYSDETGDYYCALELMGALTWGVDPISSVYYQEQIARIYKLESYFGLYSDYISDTNKKKWGKL